MERSLMSTQYSSRKKGQALLSAVMVSGMGIAILTALVSYIIKSNEEKLSMMNEADAKFLNEMTFARVGQAISSTAILCNELTKTCKWNDNPDQNFKTDKYGFKSWKAVERHVEFKVENCLPTKSDVVEPGSTSASGSTTASLMKCEKYYSTVNLEIMSIQDALDKEIIKKDANTNQTTDNDPFVLAMRVETKFISGANGNEQGFVSTALMRRPRSFVSMQPGIAMCKPDCAVPEGQARVEAACYGAIGMFTNSTNLATVTGMKVRNDGPGYLYRIGLKRDFIVNPDLMNSSGVSSNLTQTQLIPFKDASNKDVEIAPGKDVEFSDNVECAHETQIHNSEVHHTSYQTAVYTHVGFDAVTTDSSSSSQTFSSSTYNPNSSRPTGGAIYQVDTSKIVPSNYLQLDSEGAAVPSTLTDITNVTHVNTVITTTIYLGQN